MVSVDVDDKERHRLSWEVDLWKTLPASPCATPPRRPTRSPSRAWAPACVGEACWLASQALSEAASVVARSRLPPRESTRCTAPEVISEGVAPGGGGVSGGSGAAMRSTLDTHVVLFHALLGCLKIPVECWRVNNSRNPLDAHTSFQL